jgi:hypothetical protein
MSKELQDSVHANKTDLVPLPLVVQIAFAGARNLFDAKAYPALDQNAEQKKQFQGAVQTYLTKRLQQLRTDLKLESHHELCGVSSLAIGGDTCFTKACQALGWKQRILLPQAREEFLNAKGSSGYDFSDDNPSQPSKALTDTCDQLLKSPHVIEERVMSISADRTTRFQDVNLALVEVADLVICLLRADAQGKVGGTSEAAEFAQHYNKPVLRITVAVQTEDNLTFQPSFSEVWSYNVGADAKQLFTPPSVPTELASIPAPKSNKTQDNSNKTTVEKADSPTELHDRLKDYASAKSKTHQNRFKYAALVIVGTHVLATLLALAADHDSLYFPWFIVVEFLLLGVGWIFHFWLHHSKDTGQWALFRLTSEICRSTKNLTAACAPQSLRRLFDLPLPKNLQPLLSKLNVLHIERYHHRDATQWRQRRDTYLVNRLIGNQKNQLPYYQRESTKANWKLWFAKCVFQLGSFGAILAVVVEFVHAKYHLSVPDSWSCLVIFTENAGFLATFLPVLAVAALSLAAAFDLEARKHSYHDMAAFLKQQVARLQAATSENEFSRLVLETEVRLIGETANWYARRAFTGVA